MCGIAGFAGSGSQSDLERMTRSLIHRGPDEEGFFVDPERRVHLGHRRLSIIDLHDGQQPMRGPDGIVVVYNGEIYNHAELRTDLERKGHRFVTSHSDTEVLLHGYREWGDCVTDRLNGMFAFVLYDSRRARLLFARDRFGEKPLYYVHRPGLFAFASELHALCDHGDISPTLDERAVQKYFAYGYVPAPGAIWAGFAKLPSGSRGIVDLRSEKLEVHRYWRYSLEPDESIIDADEPKLIEELQELLRQAVRRRLVSDVPLGIFLSGGLDSSTIVALASRELGGELTRTFTIGFNEASFDESSYAQRIAEVMGVDWQVKTLDVEMMRELIPTVLERLDEPLSDPSILPTYLLCRHTREHVTVALSGDGGDELFAGYDPFLALAPAKIYDSLVPEGLHTILRQVSMRLPISNSNMSLDFRLRRTLAGLSYDRPLWNPVWMGPLEPADIEALFENPLPLEELYEEAIAEWERCSTTDLLDRSLEFFGNFYLPEDILAKVDRAAMMVSLESRAVYLDNDLVDFCCRLPGRFKLRGRERKYLLRKALIGCVPDDILRRPKKGFGIPVRAWLREVPDRFPMAPIPGARSEWAAERWREHRTGDRDNRMFLWSWLSMQSFAGCRSAETERLVSVT